jgi:hypothetical protein
MTEFNADRCVKAIFMLLILSSPIIAPTPTTQSHASPLNGGLRGVPFPATSAPRIEGSTPLQYDQQLGFTFSQDFQSLVYNVTAVAQTNADGYGPVYLLNGLTNTGFWYQVGVSWNWNGPAPTAGYSPGFNLNYEVFAPDGNSIFPTNNESGINAYSGRVNQGDNVELSLSFVAGDVLMYSKDLNTGATASVAFNSRGGVYFVGLDSVSNGRGYFTGLMTEEYHSTAHFAGEAEVVYSSASVNLTSGYLWIDEYNASNMQVSFTQSLNVNFSDPKLLQSLSFEGADVYADANTFITGLVDSALLTLSYSVIGGGSGYSPPQLTYLSDGVHREVNLTQTPATYFPDVGSQWNVSSLLGGSSPAERWIIVKTANGTGSTAGTTEVVTYYHQYALALSYSITGGGSPPGPVLVGTEFGRTVATILQNTPEVYFLDAGSGWKTQGLLNGSSSTVRWITFQPITGIVSSNVGIQMAYVHQYFVTTISHPTNGGVIGNLTGWHQSGSIYNLAAQAVSGWKFGEWTGVGLGSYTGPNASSIIYVVGPIIENGTFYPGLTVFAQQEGEVKYSYSLGSGVVASNTSVTIYAPPGDIISLVAEPTSFLYEFSRWYPSSTGTSGQASLLLDNPTYAQANFELNQAISSGILAFVLAVIAAALLTSWRSGRKEVG